LSIQWLNILFCFCWYLDFRKSTLFQSSSFRFKKFRKYLFYECSITIVEVFLYIIFNLINYLNCCLSMSSNIQQFSCYFKQLPALDKHRWNGSRKAIVSARRIKEGDDGDVYVFYLDFESNELLFLVNMRSFFLVFSSRFIFIYILQKKLLILKTL
jgi:hypothetical protein